MTIFLFCIYISVGRGNSWKSTLVVLDAFSDYNKIFMHPDDHEKTAFITDRGWYRYKVMPFDKKAGATYQLLANKMFSE